MPVSEQAIVEDGIAPDQAGTGEVGTGNAEGRRRPIRATQEDLNATALESLGPLSVIVGLVYLIFAGSHAFLLEPPASLIMTVLALSSSVAAAAIFITVRNNVIRPSRAHAYFSCVSLLILLNSTMHLLMTREAQHSTNFFLLIVGVSLFYASTRWFATTYAVILLTWFLLPSDLMTQKDFIHYSYMLVASCFVGIAAFVTRVRSNKNLITLRKKYQYREEQLETALSRIQLGMAAERDSKAKSAFLANMSHELRTPLNAIVGFSEIMNHELFGKIENKQYQQYVQNIFTSGQHLLHLVNDILDLSKVDAQMMKKADSVVDVDRVGNSCLTILSERATRGEVSIGYIEDDSLKAIYTDEQRLKQILINLLSNAIKFTPSGGVVWLKVGQEKDRGVFFSVRDTGIGMNEEELEMSSTPFWQADADIKGPNEGTGLGLALSREFAKMLGGSLTLTSAPDAGTTATLWLSAACRLEPDALENVVDQDRQAPHDAAAASGAASGAAGVPSTADWRTVDR